jgi:hypothetical protein
MGLMSEPGQDPDSGRAKPRGEAAWKAHLQAVAANNDRARAAGKRERLEREQRAASERRAREIRSDAELASKLDPRFSN